MVVVNQYYIPSQLFLSLKNLIRGQDTRDHECKGYVTPHQISFSSLSHFSVAILDGIGCNHIIYNQMKISSRRKWEVKGTQEEEREGEEWRMKEKRERENRKRVWEELK